VVLLLLVTAASAKDIALENKKYIDYFQNYYLSSWHKPEFKLDNKEVYETLRQHRKSYNAFSKIAVLKIERVNAKTKRIHYYYKSWYKGIYPEPFWATISKLKGKNNFKVISVSKSTYELGKTLESTFSKNYIKLKKLFEPKNLHALTSLKYANDLLVSSNRSINDLYLNPIHFNAISDKDNEFYALYSIQYEKGVVGYIMHTPQCYGVPESGLVLFVINENKLEFNIFRDKNYFRSRILIREPSCEDGDEKWSTKGYFVDINNDGYLDIITKYQYKKQKKRQRLRPRTRYFKYTYRGKGRYRFSRLSKRSFKKIIGTE